MSTRLSLLCNRVIEAGWLSALLIIPLYFNPSSSRVFEPDKLALFRSIAVIMALAWLLKAIFAWGTGKKPYKDAQPASRQLTLGLASHPIVVLVGLFLINYLLATAFSILPRISFWGYYARLYGLYSASAYLVVFGSILALLRESKQLQRLVSAVLIASVPMALYGIFQHFDFDPLTWQRLGPERVHATMGNPVFLAATLAMAAPLAFYRLVAARRRRRFVLVGLYLLVLTAHLVCMVFTQSRGPLLGLFVGGFFGGLCWSLLRCRWRAAWTLLGLSLAGVVLLVVINLPGTPLGFVEQVPYVSRLTRLSDVEGSSAGRVLIWQGALELITADAGRAVVGYGPETVRFAYYPYYSAEIGRTHGWQAFPDRLHNEVLDVLVTTGGVGLVLYVLLMTALVLYSLRWLGLLASRRQRDGFLGLWVLGGVVGVVGLRWVYGTWTLTGVGLPLGLLGGVLVYLGGYAWSGRSLSPEGEGRKGGMELLMVVLLTGVLAHFIETNVGIAVSATRLLFWVYAGLLVVLGLFFQGSLKTQAPAEASRDAGSSAAIEEKTSGFSSKSSKSSGAERAEKRKGKKKKPARQKASTKKKTPRSRRPASPSLDALSLGTGLLLATLAYAFSAPGIPTEHPGSIVALLIATWLTAGLLLIFEQDTTPGLRDLAHYAGLSLAPPVLLWIVQATGLDGATAQLRLYYLIVLPAMVVLGLLLHRDHRAAPGRVSALRLVLALALMLVAVAGIHRTNLRMIEANMHQRSAKAAFEQQQYNRAEQLYRRALVLAPDQELYQLEFAQLLAAQAHYRARTETERDALFAEAEHVLLEAAAANPFEQYLRAGLAEIYRLWAKRTEDAERRTERFERAIATLEEAIQIVPESFVTGRRLAETYAEVGDQTRALEKYNQTLAWDSTNVSLYMQLGTLYRAEGAWSQAAAMYEGALRHSRRPLPVAHQALTVVYQRLERLQAALRAGERAVELAPEVPSNHEALIGLYVRLGRCPQALAQVEEAVQRWPDRAELVARAASLRQQCSEQSEPG